uniref:Uncharacterized protein n=1 Tax=Amphimedon queenslandica TaxID=400682 RepID=A0A1X7U6U2_AMPQE
MISSLLTMSLPTQILLGRDKWIMFITMVMKNFKDGGEFLNLKFVTAARLFPGSPTTPMSHEIILNSTLMSLLKGTFNFLLSYLITGSISQHYELRKAVVSNMPKTLKNFIKVH